MRNNPKRGVKHRARKVRDTSRLPLEAEGPEAALGGAAHPAPPVQVVLDSLAHPLYVIDVADYRVHLMNRAAREAYEDGAATCYALTHHRDTPCHSEGHPCPIEIIRETGAPTVVEHIHYDKDGTPRNVEVHAFPIFDEAGVLVQIIEYTVDITARKQAEEALRQSEERQRRLIENLKGSHFIYVHDTQGVFQYLSESLPDILGYTPEEFMAHYSRYLTDHPVNQEVRRHTELSIQGIRQPPYDVNVWHKDGSSRWLEVQEVPVLDAAGRVIAVEGVAQDITERKRAEESLRQAEQRFRTIFDTTSDGIFLHDLETLKLMMCNQSFREMLGYTGEESAKLSVADLHPAADLPFIYVQIEKFLSGAKPIRHDIRFQRKDGSILIGDVTPDLVELDGKRYVMIALKDITERKRMEEELRQHAEHLEELVAGRTAELLQRTRQLQKLTLEMSEAEDRERDRLAQILHDDLQQELAAAKYHLGLARSRIKHDASVWEIIAKVDQMLKDAIGKSRSLSHELSPAVLRRGDLAEILRWLANEMQAKHGLAVHVQGQARCPSDPLKAFLYRTAQELLFNTVKHAQVSEARVRVRQRGGYLCLSVSDRGRGFDPGRLRETTGFGLLSIRERIELLGGRMKIRSAPGKGSRLFVVAPIGEATGESLTDAAQGDGRGATEEPGRLRLLLADDHEVVRQGLASLLSDEEGVEVVGEATNGREAVDLAGQLHPDVVVMDVLMPVMNGDEATRQIKKDQPRTRIVSLSMREEPEVRERMSKAGAESYILKTAPYKELLAAIRGQNGGRVEPVNENAGPGGLRPENTAGRVL